ncbi:MAG: SCP2 sterol-binding domain-containing protein [Deltaproteobacteria bacterium]|nr:SCP2 sterol-binding domain-containing protein [Deltaproteobacteria bacterium]
MNSPQDVIKTWTARVLADPQGIAALDATYKFIVKGPGGGSWVFRCKNPVGVSEGEGAADCTISMNAGDFVCLAKGELNPQMAFMSGKLDVEGDLELALKLGSIVG